MQEDPAEVPSPIDLFSLDLIDRNKLDDILFDDSTSYEMSGSTFKAFCTPIESYREVTEAYQCIKLDHLFASHIMMSCLFSEGSKTRSFNCDDGETGGGNEIEKLMKQENFKGYAIFVVRWKAGGNIGPPRFACILNVASQVIRKARIKEEIRAQAAVQSQQRSSQAPPSSQTSTPQSPMANAPQQPPVSRPQQVPPPSKEPTLSTADTQPTSRPQVPKGDDYLRSLLTQNPDK